MSPPFLRTLPREIRDLIYTYILAGPDGTITLLPWSIEVAQSLSILRTCKQLHRECKDIIWEHKRLSIREFPQLGSKLKNIHPILCGTKRWHIIVQLEVLDWDELEWVERSLSAAPTSLREPHAITIRASKERPQTTQEFQDFLDLRSNGEIVDGRLVLEYPRASSNDFLNPKSRKWIVDERLLLPDLPSSRRSYQTWMINTSWPRMSPWAKRKWLAEMLIDTTDTRKLLYRIHNTFGGRLYVDGVLCLKEGKQIVKNMKLDSRDGELTIIPGHRQEISE